MSSLGSNDVAMILNRRVLAGLAGVRDIQLLPTIRAADASVDLVEARDQGMEDMCSMSANMIMPIPLVIYGANLTLPDCSTCLTDRERLLQCLRDIEGAATGFEVRTIEDMGCPFTIRRDPQRRFTFVRDAGENTIFEVVGGGPQQGLKVTFQGTAYRGDLFNRHKATHPEDVTRPGESFHTFTMTLRYELEFLNESDVNVNAVPFQMVKNPPTPTAPQLRRLPKNGSYIFAFLRRNVAGQFDLPALAEGGGQPGGLLNSLFRGAPGDQIWEDPAPGAPPRYRVVSKGEEQPEVFVLCTIDDDINTPQRNIVAEARAGRLQLRFKEMTSLVMDPPLAGVVLNNVGKCLVKLNPTLSQSFTCPAAVAAAGDALAQLSLLGPTGMDIPLFPRSVVFPIAARVEIVLGPGQYPTVTSTVQDCDLAEAHYFPPESMGVSGSNKVSCPCPLTDFSAGADLSFGISADGPGGFLWPLLEQHAGNFEADTMSNQSALDEGLQIIDITVTVEEDHLQVHGQGSGTKPMPFFMLDIPYTFSLDLPMRFQVMPTVATNNRDEPIDRFGCVIPQWVLNSWALSLRHGHVTFDQFNAHLNPLNFLGHTNPLYELLCPDCDPPARIPAPIYDANLNEIEVEEPPDPLNPPAVCASQGADDLDRFGQASFFADTRLQPMWTFRLLEPGESDMEVDVEIDGAAAFWSAMVGGLFFFWASIPLFTQIMVNLLPLVNPIAASTLTGKVLAQIRSRALPDFDPDVFPAINMGIFLEDPSVREPLKLEKDAIIMRNFVWINPVGGVQGC